MCAEKKMAVNQRYGRR